MTILITRLHAFALRTTDSPRRMAVVVIMLAGIFAAGALLLITQEPQAIKYSQRTIQITDTLCPGETFEFPISITVEAKDAVAKVTEGWCKPDGICPDAWQAPEKKYNFVDPYSVSSTVTRSVPADMTPGTWQLRHCNEMRFTAGVDVTCYQAQVEVIDCAN